MKEITYNDFLSLTEKWNEETRIISNPSVIYANQNYLDIISIGTKAIPWILKDWETSDRHWFDALYKITGENPIQSINSGNIIKMKEDWILWAINNKYIKLTIIE